MRDPTFPALWLMRRTYLMPRRFGGDAPALDRGDVPAVSSALGLSRGHGFSR